MDRDASHRSLHRTRIKFCGIKRQQDLDDAIRLGVDALGFVCVPGSKRYLSPADAGQLRARMSPMVTSVLLLSDASREAVLKALEQVKPDLIQFHGSESPDFCDSFDCGYIKAVSVHQESDVRTAVERYPGAKALLLDAPLQNGLGGTGTSFDWTLIPRDLPTPIILAGGLNPENVGRAVRMAPLFAVDVSSGIESAPGVKDLRQMQGFVRAVQLADDKRSR